MELVIAQDLSLISALAIYAALYVFWNARRLAAMEIAINKAAGQIVDLTELGSTLVVGNTQAQVEVSRLAIALHKKVSLYHHDKTAKYHTDALTQMHQNSIDAADAEKERISVILNDIGARVQGAACNIKLVEDEVAEGLQGLANITTVLGQTDKLARKNQVVSREVKSDMEALKDDLRENLKVKQDLIKVASLASVTSNIADVSQKQIVKLQTAEAEIKAALATLTAYDEQLIIDIDSIKKEIHKYRTKQQLDKEGTENEQ